MSTTEKPITERKVGTRNLKHSKREPSTTRQDNVQAINKLLNGTAGMKPL